MRTQSKKLRAKDVVKASSLPISVGAQILLHYLSSCADNSYSPRSVSSVLFKTAHSLARTGVDTHTRLFISPALSISLAENACCPIYIHVLIYVRP